ncbi:MAG: hypothetical protein RMI94_12850 [Bryobacterales bacterium]|nr:hypothetical protein [Bryobacterales bacterium]
MTRYAPSRQYLKAGLAALAFAAFSALCGVNWPPAFVPSALLLASALVLLYLASQPAIEITERHLAIGRRLIRWSDIRRVDRTGWISPLVVQLTLADDRRILLIYPGDQDSAASLLRQLRRMAREALIDGIPYKQYWGESAPPKADRRTAPARFHLLRPEDEAEVERLYRRLKSVGHLDPKNPHDEP